MPTSATNPSADPCSGHVVEPWRTGWAGALVLGVALCLGFIRLTAPPNLLDQDQERPATYVLDAVKNGNWLCQRDLSGEITSKPPLYTWLSAGLTQLAGRISLATLYIPCVLAGLGTAGLILLAGRIPFGITAALFGALMFMLTPAGLKLFGLARTDSMFTLTVTGAAFLAWRAWQRGRGWTWFWLVAALATLTKGPLGMLLAGLGLLAAVWERKSGHPHPVQGNHLAGLLLFFLIACGWFVLAWLGEGQALIDKLIGRELVGHMVKDRKSGLPSTLLWQQPLFYLGRAAPWSLLAYYGVWRIWKQPAAVATERRFERFLCCWFVVGLLLFSLSPHQRADLLWPLMPAAALIAGRELVRLIRNWSPGHVRTTTLAVTAALVLGYGVYYYAVRRHQPVIQRTLAVRALAAQLETALGTEPPLTFLEAPGPRQTDAPPALQIYLNIFRPPVTAERAAALLRGNAAAFVALDNPARVAAARGAEDSPRFTVVQADTNSGLTSRILSNRADFGPHAEVVFAYGPFDVRLREAHPIHVSQRLIRVRAESAHSLVTVSNALARARPLRIEILCAGNVQGREGTLHAGEAWTVKAGN